jgi:hypothetical protein
MQELANVSWENIESTLKVPLGDFTFLHYNAFSSYFDFKIKLRGNHKKISIKHRIHFSLSSNDNFKQIRDQFLLKYYGIFYN